MSSEESPTILVVNSNSTSTNNKRNKKIGGVIIIILLIVISIVVIVLYTKSSESTSSKSTPSKSTSSSKSTPSSTPSKGFRPSNSSGTENETSTPEQSSLLFASRPTPASSYLSKQSSQTQDCKLSEWSSWSACDPKTWIKNRTRFIIDYTGGTCDAPLKDEVNCDKESICKGIKNKLSRTEIGALNTNEQYWTENCEKKFSQTDLSNATVIDNSILCNYMSAYPEQLRARIMLKCPGVSLLRDGNMIVTGQITDRYIVFKLPSIINSSQIDNEENANKNIKVYLDQSNNVIGAGIQDDWVYPGLFQGFTVESLGGLIIKENLEILDDLNENISARKQTSLSFGFPYDYPPNPIVVNNDFNSTIKKIVNSKPKTIDMRYSIDIKGRNEGSERFIVNIDYSPSILPDQSQNCEVSGWGPWSTCDTTTWTKKRTRTITKYGGGVCNFPLSEEIDCAKESICKGIENKLSLDVINSVESNSKFWNDNCKNLNLSRLTVISNSILCPYISGKSEYERANIMLQCPSAIINDGDIIGAGTPSNRYFIMTLPSNITDTKFNIYLNRNKQIKIYLDQNNYPIGIGLTNTWILPDEFENINLSLLGKIRFTDTLGIMDNNDLYNANHTQILFLFDEPTNLIVSGNPRETIRKIANAKPRNITMRIGFEKSPNGFLGATDRMIVNVQYYNMTS